MEGENNIKKEVTTDDLAIMIQKGFLSMDEKLGKIETNIKEIKEDTENIKADLNKKVDKVAYNTLTYRVEKLEKKFA